MAVLNLEEQEQVDAFKSWWKSNGNFILGAVLVGLVAMGGWRGWNYYQSEKTNEAATLFGELNQQLESNDAKRINDAATAMMDKFPSSAYATRSALLAANINELVQDTARAKTQLQWAIDHADEPTLRDVARLRLAALLLDEKNYAEAMKLVEAAHASSFDALYADMKGDVLSAQGKSAEARAAYQVAVDKIADNNAYRNLIQMKLDALVAAK